MRGKLRPVSGQAIVVTGAGSGLGLAIAEAAARAGAAVVMAGADEAVLRQACAAVTGAGGRAYAVAADPATAEGADRIARAAAARFDRIDSWIDASGDTRSLVHAAEVAVRHFRARAGVGVLVGFGGSLSRAVRAELRRGQGRIATTMIRLPRGAQGQAPSPVVIEAALFAAAHPRGHLAVAPGGERLTAISEAQKHRGLILGVGLVAVAAAATWLLREQIAAQAKPRLRGAIRPLVIAQAKRRPMQALSLAARHPRGALKLMRALR